MSVTDITELVRAAPRHIPSCNDTTPGLNQEAGDDIDLHRNLPSPDPACLYGLVGDVARAASTTTEANPYAVALNFICYLAVALGRRAFMAVGNTWHHPRLFTLQIGRTGRGRKGDAVSLVHRIDMALRKKYEHLAPQVHRGGLSTREGLALMIHDGWTEGKKEIAPIHDKRLWVVESEFANVLQQGKRDGNTLSAALRDAWDGVCIKPATKSSRVWASNPHIGLSGAVTPSELRELMASRELTNGFANRFLMIFAERTQIIPFPQPTSQEQVDALAEKVAKVLQCVSAEHHAERDCKEIKLSAGAQVKYAALYIGELNDQGAGELINGLLERRAPMLLRLAMIFALCDQTLVVEEKHIDAALAWIRYYVESVKYVFANAVDEVTTAKIADMGKNIEAFLAQHDNGATRVEISRKLFNGHQTKEVLDAALDALLSATPPRIVLEVEPRADGQHGRSTKRYRLWPRN